MYMNCILPNHRFQFFQLIHVDTDTEETIESVLIDGVSVLSGSNLEKM